MSEDSQWLLDWPVSGGARVGRAELKTSPEDFRVTELLWPEREDDTAAPGPVEVSGDGEHLGLRLEKTGDNTEYVARELAALAGGLLGRRRQGVGRVLGDLVGSRAAAEEALAAEGIDPRARAETLPLASLAALARSVAWRGKKLR